jgi:hypothetical protein
VRPYLKNQARSGGIHLQAKVGVPWSEAGPGGKKRKTLSEKELKPKRTVVIALIAEHLPSNLQALSLSPHTTKKKKKKIIYSVHYFCSKYKIFRNLTFFVCLRLILILGKIS